LDIRTRPSPQPSPRKRGEGARRRQVPRPVYGEREGPSPQGWEGEGPTVGSAQSGQEASLETAWPIDLRLTVASHGWVHLEPWRWEAESGTLSRAERIAGRLGAIALRQRDPTTLSVAWQGFGAEAASTVMSRAARWVSADWDPAAAVAALAPRFPEEAALVARGGGRLLRCSTFYEDFIQTLLTVNTSWSGTCRMVAALVADPGGGAFSLPEMIMEYGEERLRLIAKQGFRAPVAVSDRADARRRRHRCRG